MLRSVLRTCPMKRTGMRPRQPRAADSSACSRSLESAARGCLGRIPVRFIGRIRNTDRSIGAALAGQLAMRSGNAGTAHAPLEVRLTGSAGQSLWAFALPGMHVRVEGDANDGVGKSMHGGEIVIRPPHAHRSMGAVLVGNAALYGATGGRMFVAGQAGERFAVRNSGAWAVVEGLGDHGCEYMTGGAVMVLGRVGRNFGAGMTGGIAYVLDRESLEQRVHRSSVELRHGLGYEEVWIRAWLAEHHERTGSTVAADLLRDWTKARDRFCVVTPLGRAEVHAHETSGASRAASLTKAL